MEWQEWFIIFWISSTLACSYTLLVFVKRELEDDPDSPSFSLTTWIAFGVVVVLLLGVMWPLYAVARITHRIHYGEW